MKHILSKKLLGFAAVAALAIPASTGVFAQTETVTANLTTNSSITTANVSDMDFGEWLLIYGGTGTGVLTLTDDGSVSATATTTPAGSVFSSLTPSASEGVVTVSIPAAVSMTMTRSNLVDFTDAGLSLSAVTYRTATENGTLNTDGSFGTVTVTAANAAETVTFGGEVAITATPADAAHSATFDVTFSY